MYLTSMNFSDSGRYAMQLENPQKVHALVARSFEGDDRALWRRDGLRLWVMSHAKPTNTDSLPDHATRNIDEALSSTKNGDTINFRVQLNCVRSSKPTDGESRGKVRPVPRGLRDEWARHKLAGAGLDVSEMWVEHEGVTEFLHYQKKRHFTPSTYARFEGVATVTDADALREAVSAGLGRQKAYGNGLLLFARA